MPDFKDVLADLKVGMQKAVTDLDPEEGKKIAQKKLADHLRNIFEGSTLRYDEESKDRIIDSFRNDFQEAIFNSIHLQGEVVPYDAKLLSEKTIFPSSFHPLAAERLKELFNNFPNGTNEHINVTLWRFAKTEEETRYKINLTGLDPTGQQWIDEIDAIVRTQNDRSNNANS
jgi:hypothetical protein